MINNDKIESSLKYNIKQHLNKDNQKLILNELKISQPTFWRKCNCLVIDEQGFEATQLIKIGRILNVNAIELISLEAKIYNDFLPADKLKDYEKRKF